MITIALVSHLSELSGAGISLVEKAAALRDRQFRCICIFPDEGPMVEKARQRGLEVQIVPNPQISLAASGPLTKLAVTARRLLFVVKLRQLFLRESVSVVFVNTTASIFPGVAARLAGRPIIWQVHEVIESPASSTVRKLRYIEKHADAILYDAHAGEAAFRAEAVSRRLICPNYIEANQLSQTQRVSTLSDGIDISETDVVISMNGPFRRKGGDVFVRAAIQVLRTRSDIPLKFLLMGQPEAANPAFVEGLKRSIQESDTGDRIILTGPRNDVARLLKRSNLFVSASRNEARPIIVTEAMAIGTPVIATNVGDCMELLQHGSLGTLIPPDNAEALALAILDFLNNPQKACEKARNAQDNILSQFNSPAFWDPLVKLIREVAAEHTG